MADYSYIGKGTIYMETGSGGLVAVGNCSKLTLTTEEEKKELPDYQNAGGGNDSSVSRIKSVAMAFTAHDISPANLAIATRGAIDVYAGGAVTDEAHADVVLGGLVVLAHIPDPDQSMIVKEGATTLTENTEYTRVGAGIIIKAGGGLIAGDDITVSYTGLADNTVQALSESGLEYRMVFDGLNEAQSGRKVIVEAYRVKPSPSGLEFLGDEFAGLEITADVLKDTTITAAGKSQYFTAKLATA